MHTMLVRLALIFLTIVASASAVDLALPTENDALFHGGGPDFYQYIERDFGGEKSLPWQGGQYGFVRDPIQTAGGLVYRRFHEGIDIKPMHRAASGMPLDEVCAASAGTVMHASDLAGASNYGRYVVVRHVWDGCPYFTLYAHLNKVLVQPGQRVAKGDVLGILGFTGTGINLVRAHVHFEVNLLLSEDFEVWYGKYYPAEANKHGIYNGMNLCGLDVAAFLKKNRANPSLTVPEFLKSAEVFYKVRVPAPGPVALARRYPWMVTGWRSGAAEISFTRSGFPLKITATEEVSAPRVSWAMTANAPLRYLTKDFVGGTSRAPILSADGLRYLDLLCR